MPESAQNELRAAAEDLQHAVLHAMSELRRLNKVANERRQAVDVELVRFTLKPIIDELQEKYAAHQQLVTFLDEVEADMVSNTEVFKLRADEQTA